MKTSSVIYPAVVSLLLLMVSACQSKEPAELKSYLMQHPAVLTEAISACEKQAASPRCDVVSSVATEMHVLMEDHDQNPEAFGQRILHAQMQYAETGQGGDELIALLAVVGMYGPE